MRSRCELADGQHHFNVYLADFRWIWVGEFWAGDNQGIEKVGAHVLDTKSYSRPVYIKRMS
jgi:hypothetical protein